MGEIELGYVHTLMHFGNLFIAMINHLNYTYRQAKPFFKLGLIVVLPICGAFLGKVLHHIYTMFVILLSICSYMAFLVYLSLPMQVFVAVEAPY